ncbi:MAG TPA: tetratricopeptide repeat protein [Candidatus Acidoferrum sp.]|nr:tetratricopeptide repeat protein [Candidatus Acidoferrum sp.]
MEPNAFNYEFGEFTLDEARGCLLRAGKEIKLRPKVYETLRYFVERPGRLIGKEELIKAVWEGAFVTDDSLVQCTLELRRALSDHGQKLLKTVPRRGYIFNATVTRVPAKSNIPPAREYQENVEAGESAPTIAARKRYDLPVPRTSLLGRTQQVAQATELLLRKDVRLLSLTGPGGAGKTRLAIAVAEAAGERFKAGVRFASLGSITDPELVSSAVAEVFGLQQTTSRAVPELLGERLRESGPFLLVLDNFEQVLGAATLVAQTLEACPSLKILVTSRARLRVYGEHEFMVTPLPESAALELFTQRAAAVKPGFAMSAENEAAIREICLRLDGLPLAIELAAAHSKMLSPNEILERLQSRLKLLTGGALDLPERQQALRKTIDWSYSLLNDAERRLFRRLAVFAGGCSLEAAEAVCNTSLDLGVELFDGLSSLLDKNLIQRMDRGENEARFTMLETIREYALERLVEGKEEDKVRRAHAAYCLVFAEEGNPELDVIERARWLALCDVEINNLRAALDWLFATRELDWGLRLCIALFQFWDMREHVTEGRARLEAILRLSGNGHSKERGRVLHFLGAVVTAQGDYPAAQRFLEQSLVLYEDLQDDWGIAASLNALAISQRDRGDYASAEKNLERCLACWRGLPDRLAIARCLHNLANVVKVRGDYRRARSALHEATKIFEELGDRSGAAWSVNQLGDIEREQGALSEAATLYQRALSTFREAGDRWGSARSLTDLGYIDCEQGNYSRAHAAYREAMATFAELGHRRGVARVLEGFACLAESRGEATRAIKLAAAATNLRRMISTPLPQAEKSKLDQKLQPAWDALSGAQGDRAWAEGAAMDMPRAVQFSLEEPATEAGRGQ